MVLHGCSWSYFSQENFGRQKTWNPRQNAIKNNEHPGKMVRINVVKFHYHSWMIMKPLSNINSNSIRWTHKTCVFNNYMQRHNVSMTLFTAHLPQMRPYREYMQCTEIQDEKKNFVVTYKIAITLRVVRCSYQVMSDEWGMGIKRHPFIQMGIIHSHSDEWWK